MAKQYILAYREKGSRGKFKNAGPYVYAKKSQFGSLARIKRDNPNYEYRIIEKR